MKKLFTFICAAALLAACSDSDDDSKKFITVDFEDVPESILAVDTYGSNFYDGYGEGQYTGYTDSKSGLKFRINEEAGIYNFWNGGIVFSTLNEDQTTNDSQNQCTVNYVNPKTKNGGYKGSKIFAIAHIATDPYNNFGEPTIISFADNEENVIDHFWVMNTMWATLSMKEGGDFGAKAYTYKDHDFLSLTITGYTTTGAKTGSVVFYLADFRTEDSPGIIEDWTKVDLSKLGQVNRLEFTMDSSDKNPYGIRTPKYFCFDNIAIRK